MVISATININKITSKNKFKVNEMYPFFVDINVSSTNDFLILLNKI